MMPLDLARAKGITYQQAERIIAATQAGNLTPAHRIGVHGDTPEEVIANMEAWYAGASDAYSLTYAGKREELHA